VDVLPLQLRLETTAWQPDACRFLYAMASSAGSRQQPLARYCLPVRALTLVRR
jgi:hypothetical protein